MRIGPLEVVVILVLAAIVVVLLMRARDERPANVELADLFGDPVSPQPGPRALGWAYGVLYEAGVDADGDSSYAVKVLRDADPRLSRRAATALVRRMADG